MSEKYDITAQNLLRRKARGLHAGDSYTHSFTASRGGIALDLTGAKIWFTVKQHTQETDAEAKLQLTSDDAAEIEITSALEGIFAVKFVGEGAKTTADLEGEWIYDIQIRLSTNEIITLTYGKIEFLPNITRTTV